MLRLIDFIRNEIPTVQFYIYLTDTDVRLLAHSSETDLKDGPVHAVVLPSTPEYREFIATVPNAKEILESHDSFKWFSDEARSDFHTALYNMPIRELVYV